MKERLTPVQRQILTIMIERGPAAFGTGQRGGVQTWPAKDGGIIISGYQNPEYFLKHRGLIEKIERNVPGYWYKITEKGRAAL